MQTEKAAPHHRRLPLLLLGTALFFLAISAINPHDYFTWLLEVAPALIGWTLLAVTYRRFPVSGMFYLFVWLHSIILIVGGHYTYAEVPLFNWIRDALHTQRNSYDGIGHFAQGFFPAIYAREILLRLKVVEPKKQGWVSFLAVSVCLAFSAFYELIEWQVALLTGSKGDAFLGTQGDIWDTQKDMALCLLGSILAVLFLSRAHDRSVEKLQSRLPASM